MRLRTLKPGFFKNEDLARAEPLARIIYQALWCLADREGRLEDRPVRIKVEALPYDDCDPEALLAQLADLGFIVRYAVGGKRLIWIPTFLEHQNPHHRETPSKLPPPPSEAEPDQGAASPGKGAEEPCGLRSSESGLRSSDSPPAPPRGAARAGRASAAEGKPRAEARALFLAHWRAAYERTQGMPYRHRGKSDDRAVASILQACDLAEACARADRFLAADDDFIVTTDRSLALFRARLDRPAVRGAGPPGLIDDGEVERAWQAATDARGTARASRSSEPWEAIDPLVREAFTQAVGQGDLLERDAPAAKKRFAAAYRSLVARNGPRANGPRANGAPQAAAR